MKKIQAISKASFDNNFTSEIMSSYNYACFISILDIDNNEEKFDKTIDNFLQVKMWDIEENEVGNGLVFYEKPSESELQKIVNFVNKHKDKTVFIVHCSAGISRSGAVVRYISEKFYDEVDFDFYKKNNKQIQPNLYILKTLKKLDK